METNKGIGLDCSFCLLVHEIVKEEGELTGRDEELYADHMKLRHGLER